MEELDFKVFNPRYRGFRVASFLALKAGNPAGEISMAFGSHERGEGGRGQSSSTQWVDQKKRRKKEQVIHIIPESNQHVSF